MAGKLTKFSFKALFQTGKQGQYGNGREGL